MQNTMPEPGCYVDSHWGQYAIARMVQVATEFGYKDDEGSNLAVRHLAAMGSSTEPTLDLGEFELLVDAADDAEAWLNDNVAVDGHAWGWNEGDFGLYPNDYHDDCDEDDAAVHGCKEIEED